MLRTLKYNLLFSLVLYVIVYLVRTFIIWDFTNPFQWIIDIPTYESETRAGLLFSYVVYQLGSILMIHKNN